MSAHEISRSSVVVAHDDHISCDLAGEAAILDFKSGVYYGLDEVGARVWSLVAEPRTVDEICDSLVAEYEVEPNVCERDVVALLTELAAKGLVEVRDGAKSG